jgi:hypothetical protein
MTIYALDDDMPQLDEGACVADSATIIGKVHLGKGASVCVRLATAPGRARSFRYVYDFGDDWEHRIKIERRLPPDPLFDTALCLGGANATPPEDVGGVHGYTDFVAAMADPDHPDRHDMLEWYGRPFDPTAFDISAADMRLHRIKV